MDKFAQMKKQEAESFCKRYIALSEEGIRRLFSETKSLPIFKENNILLASYSSEGLIPLWKWLSESIIYTNSEKTEELPIWFSPQFCGTDITKFSSTSIWRINGISYYFAESLKKINPNAKWEMAYEPKVRNFIYHKHPVLTGFKSLLSPLQIVIIQAELIRRFPERNKPDLLFEKYKSWEALI